jgi:Protein of unknown function, DUF481
MWLPVNLPSLRAPRASSRLKPDATRLLRHVDRCIVAVVLVLASGADAQAQKTDVVMLRNGDRITGEITKLDRGRLEFSTDDAGTLYLEWDKLASLVAARLFEVELEDGTKYLGNLGGAPPRSITVVAAGFSIPLQMSVVTRITPIGRSFWSKIDGSIDLGFSYTRSSGVAQLNANWNSIYRRPASTFRTALSLTATDTDDDDEGRDDRGSFEASYLRYPWKRWFLSVVSRFETNESLGLTLRSQVGGAVGPRLVNTNRAQLVAGGGLVVNDERGVDVEPTQNLEALFTFGWSFYTYDQPKTNLDVTLQYYPSLSDPGRHRVQFDAAVKQELFKDFFVSVSGYNSYDSRPPNPTFANNDVGVVLSIGWSY